MRIEQKNGKKYRQRNINLKTLRPFRKQQEVVMAGLLKENCFIEFGDGRKLFINKGEYVYEDVDKKLKTMDRKTFESTHNPTTSKLVSINITRDTENKIKEFIEFIIDNKSKFHKEAFDVAKKKDINRQGNRLIRVGIESVFNMVRTTEMAKREFLQYMKDSRQAE